MKEWRVEPRPSDFWDPTSFEFCYLPDEMGVSLTIELVDFCCERIPEADSTAFNRAEFAWAREGGIQ